jgi:hypothetical protein
LGSPQIEAANPVLLDGRDGGTIEMKLAVVTKDEPALGTDDSQPFVVRNVLRKITSSAVMMFDYERRLHLEQGFWKAIAKAAIKVKGG